MASIKEKLDSLQQKKHEITKAYHAKSDALKSKTLAKLNQVEMTPEMKQQLGPITEKINNFNITEKGFVKIAELNMKGLPADVNVESISKNISKVSTIGEVPKVDIPLGDVQGLSQQAQALNADAKNIAQGNFAEVKQLPQTISSAKESTIVQKVFETEQKVEGSLNPAESKVTLVKGEFKNMTITPNDDKYSPSMPFSKLASTAFQYVKDDLGVTYNDRISNMTTVNIRNSTYGTKSMAKDIGEGLSSGTSAMAGGNSSEVYYKVANGATYISNIPRDGKVPPAYQVREAGKLYK